MIKDIKRTLDISDNFNKSLLVKYIPGNFLSLFLVLGMLTVVYDYTVGSVNVARQKCNSNQTATSDIYNCRTRKLKFNCDRRTIKILSSDKKFKISF